MTFDRLNEIRGIAAHHPGRQSTALILELCDAIQETNKLYCLALDFGWSNHRSKAIAFNQLKALALYHPQTTCPLP